MPYLDLGAKETGGLDLGAQESSSTLALTVSSSDTISLSDAAANNSGSIYSFADTLDLADLLDVIVISNRKKIWEILVADTLSLSDSILSAATWALLLTDTNTLSDAVSPLFERFLTFSDSISLSDAIGNLDSFADVLSLSDAAAYTLADVPITDYTFLLTDALSINDSSMHISVPAYLSINDTLLLSDRAAVRVQANLTDYLRRYLNDVPTPLT